MPVHPFPPGADGYSEERLCITLLSTLVATELKVRPVDCSPSVLEAVLFPCCTSSCASQGPFGALGLLRGGERTWCAGLVPFGVVFARRGHSYWSDRRRGRLQLLLWLEGGGGGACSRPSGRDDGSETLLDEHAVPSSHPLLQTTSQLCAPLSQSTSVTPAELPALLSVRVRVERSTAEPGLRARRLADTGSEREEEPVAPRRLFI